MSLGFRFFERDQRNTVIVPVEEDGRTGDIVLIRFVGVAQLAGQIDQTAGNAHHVNMNQNVLSGRNRAVIVRFQLDGGTGAEALLQAAAEHAHGLVHNGSADTAVEGSVRHFST